MTRNGEEMSRGDRPACPEPDRRVARLDLDAITALIHEEKDPAALQAKLVAMIQEAHPVNPFKDGEIMPLYEFERRFKKFFCYDVEPIYLRRMVKVVIDPAEGLMLSLTPLLVFGLEGELSRKGAKGAKEKESEDGKAL